MTAPAVDRTTTVTAAGDRAEIHVEAHTQDFVLDTCREGQVEVVLVRGEVDIATAPLVRSALDTIVDRFPQRVEIDLSGVTFLDAYALASLLAIRRSLPTGRTVALRDPSPIARRVLALTGLCHTFEITTATAPRGLVTRRAS